MLSLPLPLLRNSEIGLQNQPIQNMGGVDSGCLDDVWDLESGPDEGQEELERDRRKRTDQLYNVMPLACTLLYQAL